ncbi:MAG: hypothetical protein ABIS50_07140 [Luteolibacter sp.]|uniref:hypothetical protein n=1 Tax=Luteolibacter sp. TaxID=1962973 RepID=UPI0032640203
MKRSAESDRQFRLEQIIHAAVKKQPNPKIDSPMNGDDSALSPADSSSQWPQVLYFK